MHPPPNTIPYSSPNDLAASPGSDTMDASYNHGTPSTSLDDSGVPELPQPAKKKRRREAKNCLECKRRKIKCNREKPCDQCVQRGESELCQWSVLPPVDKPIGRSSYNALKEQLSTTQAVCKELQNRYRKQIDELKRLRAQVANGGLASPAMPAPPSPTKPSPSTQEGNSPLDPVQQFQAQAESSRSSRMDIDEPSPTSSAATSVAPPSGAVGKETAPKALIQGFETLEGFPAFPDLVAGMGRQNRVESNADTDVWRDLPAKWICDALVEFFFSSVEWHICMCHRPTFYAVYQQFWAVQTPDEGAEQIDAEWMTLLWVILCLALTSMGPAEVISQGICGNRESWRSMGAKFWTVARESLRYNDWSFMASRKIEIVQALILFSYCNLALDNQGYKGQSVMTSWAIRIAMNQGLHRLGREVEGVVPPRGLLFREIRRRLWWNLVFLDWNISTQMGRTYFIHPDQVTTAKPLNMDWDDMVDGRVLIPKVTGERTSASMLLAKVDLAGTVRELSDRLNSNLPIDQAYLLSHQKRLDGVRNATPDCWKVMPAKLEWEEPEIKWERLQFELHYNNRKIRLHRQFMLDGYREGTNHNHPSTRACLEAARRILVLFEEGKRGGFPGSLAWYNVMYCWMAAVIMAMDGYYCPDGSALMSPTARQDYIDYAIRALEHVGDISDLAPRGSSVLRFVLSEVRKRTTAAVQKSPTTSHSSNDSTIAGPSMQLMPNMDAPLESPFPNMDEEYLAGLDFDSPDFWQSIQDAQPAALLSLAQPGIISPSNGGTNFQWVPTVMPP